VRKSFCCVKTLLGKVSAYKKFGVYFFGAVCVYNFLCVYFFLCQKNKNCSVQRLLCGKGSVCKNAYVPLFRCAKASLGKASVCKNFLLCIKASVCKGAFGTNYFLRIIPTKRHFDVFADILSGICIFSHIIIFSEILSGILSGVSSEILCS